MRIRIYRVSLSILLFISIFVGLYFCYDTFFEMTKTNNSQTEYLINLFCFVIGIVFLAFELINVFKSFKNGTILLHQIAYNKTNKIRKSTLFIAIFLLLLSIFLFTWFLLALNGNNSLSFSSFLKSDNELFIYVAIILFVNSISIIVYQLIMKNESLGNY